ncbi:DNA sulfur modification protein DndD [Aliterella atlantica]|uniref:Nuclease SbcCD subunit C n=1 Tax=Aliterella atlantica CENA595 TaxID=1618023 RepID=A0A0D8ZWG2_9CYAN|nr:DNA sulfur modification protein DndD [Aliterella atlantica]KJH73123.1 DNA sulfur modification protein DndD [Aliterella atlantica CENA595]
MIFLELVLENFGPYCGRQVLNLRPQTGGDSRPIILLGGMNGGGKTTLMDAIRLALYGHRAQCSTRNNLGYSEFLNQCVNRYTSIGEQTCIELAFEHILNNVQVEFRIKRTWTKNPKNGKDNLGILVDDWSDKALAQIWDERIEDLLPLGISNLFLFDGEQVKELAEQETPTDGVINAIKTLLGLELAERLAIDIDILVNRKRKVLADAQELKTIEEIEQKLNKQKAAHQAAKKQLSIAQDNLEKAQVLHHQASEKFLSEGGKIASDRSKLETQLNYANDAAIKQRQDLIESAEGTLPLTLISPLLEQARSQGQKELRQQQAKIAQNVLKERNQRLLDCINKLALLPEQFSKVKDFIEEEDRELERDIKIVEESWLLAELKVLNQLEGILYYLPNELNKAQEQINNIKQQEEEIIAIEKQLAAAAAPETHEKITLEVKQAQTKLIQAQTDYETTKKHCEELAKAIDKTIKELSEYSEQNIDIKNDEHIIKASTKVQTTLKLFREKLTLRKLNQLETVVTECFLYLLHKSDLVHRIAIDAKTFTLSLYDLQGKPVPKHRLSAGEKQLLAIAFLWALARVSGRNLPIAIDTPLGRLDSSHRNNLVERYFPNASHQVILLSTDTEIGQTEHQQLQTNKAIAQEYLLKYSPGDRQTTIQPGYFW